MICLMNPNWMINLNRKSIKSIIDRQIGRIHWKIRTWVSRPFVIVVHFLDTHPTEVAQKRNVRWYVSRKKVPLNISRGFMGHIGSKHTSFQPQIYSKPLETLKNPWKNPWKTPGKPLDSIWYIIIYYNIS